ncbi:MAG: histidine kinase [Eggerthellaceae bacterium]|nr:histidine kinase [Eggerthellaceae bacterium]
MDRKSLRYRRILLGALACIVAFSGCGLVYLSISGVNMMLLQLLSGLAFTLSLVSFMWIWLNPDTNSARQTDELLKLASEMLDCTKQGMSFEAAQQICELMLPATSAIAVAITDREVILGYAGYNAEENRQGSPIRTTTTHQTLEDGKPRILHHTSDIGLPASSAGIKAAIVQPLSIGESIEGTLKFYYSSGRKLSKTQESLAQGFAELLSTQIAASALEEQVKLTTSMELKALQAQINPHFMFNTINTISSLIRTDPAKARELLRDFAAFYRSTLEDSDDLIPLERELKQVERYLSFEIARFGEDRLELVIDVDPYIMDIEVPSFLIQPIVENAVKHGMRSEGKLTITITGEIDDDNVIICVNDDGKGMTEDTLTNMMDGESDTGMGIAVKNVHDRIKGYFGPESHMDVKSEPNVGTAVCFKLNRAIAEGEAESYLKPEDLQKSVLPETPDPIVE